MSNFIIGRKLDLLQILYCLKLLSLLLWSYLLVNNSGKIMLPKTFKYLWRIYKNLFTHNRYLFPAGLPFSQTKKQE